MEMPCECLEALHRSIDEKLKSSGSPKTFVQDVLYGLKGLPKGSVPHLLVADDTIREELRQLLK